MMWTKNRPDTTIDNFLSMVLSDWCQCKRSFRYICKIVIIAIYLPGGITGSWFLLSAAGLDGLVGAPLGGYVIDQFGSRFVTSSVDLLSGVALVLTPYALTLINNMKSTPLSDAINVLFSTVLANQDPHHLWFSFFCGASVHQLKDPHSSPLLNSKLQSIEKLLHWDCPGLLVIRHVSLHH